MLVWRLDLCETFITYFVGKIPSIFISDTKPVTSAACDSPHKASAAPGLFHSSYLRKVEKYFCVVRWISRLYSLQYSPWIPTVPFLRLLLAHAFYLCQENMKLNVFLFFCFFDHRIPPCVLDVFTVVLKKIAEQHGSVQYQKCCRRCYRASEIWERQKKKSVWVISVGFFLFVL